jgi:hypothetical protein
MDTKNGEKKTRQTIKRGNRGIDYRAKSTKGGAAVSVNALGLVVIG